jgi:hypothetical protein
MQGRLLFLREGGFGWSLCRRVEALEGVSGERQDASRRGRPGGIASTPDVGNGWGEWMVLDVAVVVVRGI